MNERTFVHSPEIRDLGPVHTNPFYFVSHKVALFDGFTKDYFVSEHGQRVGLVGVKDENVLLVRQYRFLINGLSWEIPGGGVDEGEELEQAAIRECLEETGISCRDLKPVIEYHLGLDVVHNPTTVFFTDEFNVTRVSDGDVMEVVEHQWVPMDQCIGMIFSGNIADSLTIVSLLSYRTLMDRAR